MKLIKTAIFLLIFVSVLVLVEFLSFLDLPINLRKNFMYECKENTIQKDEKKYIIDPLLGWTYSKNNALIDEKTNCQLLVSNVKCENPIIIYVSGGSSSDLLFESQNWVHSFKNICEQNNLCVRIYIAAIGGYSSGQELLKLISNLNYINPTIHISYTGANETENPSYASNYEQFVFQQITNPNIYGFMPNFKSVISKNKESVEINVIEPIDYYTFWKNNMENMYGISISKDYKFYGILQPVLGFGNTSTLEVNKEAFYYHNWIDNKAFYPQAKNLCTQKDYLYDFTYALDEFNTNPFVDDCHLSDVQYQNKIAELIFETIKIELVK